MSPETKQRIKFALRRFALRWLRKLVDVADDRLHAAEVKLREEIASRNDTVPVRVTAAGCTTGSTESPFRSAYGSAAPARTESFRQWEARRSGVAPVSKKAARRRHERGGAQAFDLRFAR
jgi:hypothetical protein